MSGYNRTREAARRRKQMERIAAKFVPLFRGRKPVLRKANKLSRGNHG